MTEALPPSDSPRVPRSNPKRYNERVKLLATLLNNTAVATFAGVVILPIATGDMPLRSALIWLPAGVALHLIAQGVLSLMQRED